LIGHSTGRRSLSTVGGDTRVSPPPTVERDRRAWLRNMQLLDWQKSASLLIDDDSHYLFCYTSDRNGDGINLIIFVLFYISLFTQHQQ